MRTRRLWGASALAATLLLALTGCVKVDMDIQLQSDDTVDGSLLFAVSSELAELSGQDPEALAEQMQQDMTEGDDSGTTRTEPYDDGEYIGSTTYFEGETLDYFGASSDDPDALKIVREGDEFVVSGAMDLTDAGAEDMGDVGGAMDVRIAITFPGAVGDHDGTLDGKTVVWEPVIGERTEINARGSAVEGGGLGGLQPLLIGLIALVALAAIGVVVFLVVRSRRAGAAPAPAVPGGYGDPNVGYAGGLPGDAGAVPPAQFTPQAPPVAQVPPAPPAPPAAPPAPPAAPPAPPAAPPAQVEPPVQTEPPVPPQAPEQ
ncbi:DUF3153 domain-containing protein [Cellulomonas sp. KRMCY2]|uniref:LppM family (lipo)protein n=1 Tax=Cellulomonas sp. KRMCY2 TaxID=1304865 RepID=UPI0004B8C43B|nr:DUF3153 domain-containing protein [Cellulomonas sp. KRMCY2]